MNYTCNHYWDGQCHILHKAMPEDFDLCADFRDKDGKCPRFCRLASSVDEMAEALVHGEPFTDMKVRYYFDREMKNIPYETKAEAIDAAKTWLMEVRK